MFNYDQPWAVEPASPKQRARVNLAQPVAVMVDDSGGAGAGLDFPTREDYLSGQVKQEVNPPEYDLWEGDVEHLSFLASGPPGMTGIINATLKYQLGLQGAKWMIISHRETPTRQFLGYNIWYQYTYDVVYHWPAVAMAAPVFFLALAVIVGGLVALGIIILLVQHQITRRTAYETKTYEDTLDVINAVQDPEQKAALLKLLLANQAPAAPGPSFLDQLKPFAYVALGGLGLYLGVQIVKEFRPQRG